MDCLPPVPPPDYKLKLLLIGDSEVGKTSTLKRFADDLYDERSNLSTIGKIKKHEGNS